MALTFEMDKLLRDDFTGTKNSGLAKWISEHYDTGDADETDVVLIRLYNWNEEKNQFEIAPGLEWLKNEVNLQNCMEIWVSWNEENGEMTDWWISGDNF